jgi:hypothetical protein
MLLRKYGFCVIAIILFSPFFSYGQWPNYLCETALPFCGEPIIQPSGTMGYPAQPGPSYPCLIGVLNGIHWFYFKALSSGPVVIKIEHTPLPQCPYTGFMNVVYGHFASMGDLCPDSLDNDHVLHCDYNTNTVSPPGAMISINVIAGKYYYLMFINGECCCPLQSYIIKMYQSNMNQPGAGVLDCNLVYNQPCIITFIQADTTPCNTSNNTFDINGLVGFMYPPATGSLIVKDFNSGLMDVISPPFVGQSNFSIKNIPCDGQTHTLQAWFTDGECTLDTTITAPQGDCAVGVMSGGGHICQPSGPPAEVYITAYGGLPPYSFSWSVNGVTQPEVSGYNGPWPYVISATEAGTYALLSMSGSDCPGTATGSAVVTASEPIVTLNDTTVCAGEAVVLDAGAGFSTYNWSTGYTGQVLTVTEPGTYSVTVTDSFGCQASDSATITHHPIPQPLLIKHN